jgi:murein L,D-transpeptidase YafK
LNRNQFSKSLQVWIESAAGTYELFHTYRICDISGKAGPKLQQGDLQVPEGVYTASVQSYSHYYLALHVSFPNALDRGVSKAVFRDPTLTNKTWIADMGGDIMIHGICASIGCSAMSAQIVELYAIAQAAGGSVPYHVFPFPLVPGAIAETSALPVGGWAPFWRMLQPVYDSFERDKRPAALVGRPATVAEVLAGLDFKGFLYGAPQAVPVAPRVLPRRQ